MNKNTPVLVAVVALALDNKRAAQMDQIFLRHRASWRRCRRRRFRVWR